MARLGWDAISPAYRGRLTKAGITRADYERGASLTSARGHAKTPERPERAKSKPERYKEYLAKRARLEKKVKAKKQQMFGSSRKFSKKRSDDAVANAPMALLQRFLDDDSPYYEDYLWDSDGDEKSLGWYH
jgi:hypothetical protein